MRNMLKTWLLSGFVGLYVVSGTAAAQQEDGLDAYIQSALNHAKVQDFNAAIQVLEGVSEAEKSRYDYRFTRARILTWSGQHSRAEASYVGLLQDYPGNPDVMVSYGYLQFFRGNLKGAESYFEQVLESHPTYLDAYEGLQRTYDLRRSSKEVAYETLEDAISCPTGYGLVSDGACQPISLN